MSHVAKIKETFYREVDLSNLESKHFKIEVMSNLGSGSSVRLYWKKINICCIPGDCFQNGSRSGYVQFYWKFGGGETRQFYNLDLDDLVREIRILYEEERKTFEDVKFFGYPSKRTKEEIERAKEFEEMLSNW